MIESVNNERVKNWAKLKDKKYQDIEGLFLVEGEHLVSEAKNANLLKEVIVLDGNEYDYENITYVNDAVMKKITSLSNMPKIIGVAKKIQPHGVEGRTLILDRIQDPGNMGTIIRSAVAFNIDTIIVGTGSVSIYNPKVLRSSEGMIFHINIIETDLESIIPEMKLNGYKIYTTDVVDGIEVKDITFDDKSAIIVGNEGAGVDSKLNEEADGHIYIKMNKKCESLNVGIATSIILYELNK